MMCPPGHGTDEEAVVIFQLCVNLVYDLLEQIGTGQDYKVIERHEDIIDLVFFVNNLNKLFCRIAGMLRSG